MDAEAASTAPATIALGTLPRAEGVKICTALTEALTKTPLITITAFE